MAKNPKPVKIKRYKKSSGSTRQIMNTVKNVAVFVVAAVIIVGAGYFLGKPLLNFVSQASKYKPDSSQATSSGPNSASDTVSQQPSSKDEGETPVIGIKNRVYYFADTQKLQSAQSIKTVVDDMKAKGATHCVFTVKDRDGYILYNSTNQYASQLKGTAVLDLPLVVKTLTENSITPVAQVYTFMDKMISTVERTTAVLYQGTDARWLDSSAALGGKAWANPASSVMQQYLTDLTDELISQGVKEFIFAGYSTPTGFSLDKREFGASQEQVLAHMKTLISTLEGHVSAKGGYAAWQYDYSSVMAGGNYAQYIIHPFQLGAGNVIICANSYEYDPKAAMDEMTTAKTANNLDNLTLWILDGDLNGITKAMGSYFVK